MSDYLLLLLLLLLHLFLLEKIQTPDGWHPTDGTNNHVRDASPGHPPHLHHGPALPYHALPLPRPPPHQLAQPEILPSRLPHLLRRALDPKRSMLVGNHVVFVLGVDRLVLRRHVDVIGREFVLAEVFEEIRVRGAMHVDLRQA